jgi:hypothetical protein
LSAATAGTAALGAPVSKAALDLPGMAGASDTMSLSSAIEWKLFGAAGPKIRELGAKDRVRGFKTEIVTGHVMVIPDHEEVDLHNEEHS